MVRWSPYIPEADGLFLKSNSIWRWVFSCKIPDEGLVWEPWSGPHQRPGRDSFHSPYTHLPHTEHGGAIDSPHFYNIIPLADCSKIGKLLIIASEQFQKCCQPTRGQATRTVSFYFQMSWNTRNPWHWRQQCPVCRWQENCEFHLLYGSLMQDLLG